jgi:CRISPR-associated protein Cas2
MPMTVVVTRNVKDRTRGFLGSCMCEIAPGVYVAPRMSKAVRERVWLVLNEWFDGGQDTSIVLTWPEPSQPGGQAVQTLGAGARALFEHDGVVLARGELTEAERSSLKTSTFDDGRAASAGDATVVERAPTVSPWQVGDAPEPSKPED